MTLYPPWIPTLRRLLLALAAIATILAAAWIEEDLRGERALRRLKEECRQEGKPLDYAFYTPSPVPDDQNLFMDPVVLRLGDQATRKKIPSEMPVARAYWERAQAMDLSGIYAVLGKTPAPGATARDAAGLVLASLAVASPDLDEVCQAAERRPYSQARTMSDGTFSPNFGALRYLTQALTLRAEAELALGEDDLAFRDTYTVLRLVEGCVNFPSRLHLAMANVMASSAVQPFWEGWTRHAWSEAQLGRIQALVSRLHPIRNLSTAFAADRAGYEESFEPNSRFGTSKRPSWMPTGLWKLNVARFFGPGGGSYDPQVFDSGRETISVPEMDRAQAQLLALEKGHSPYTWLIRHEAWGHNITIFIGTSQNIYSLTLTACALERYHIASGRYPTSLSDLVPRLLPAVPRDVIGGAPLVYSCADGSHFKLYSLGMNGVDDHGALPGPPPRPGASMYPWISREGDWVWPQHPST